MANRGRNVAERVLATSASAVMVLLFAFSGFGQSDSKAALLLDKTAPGFAVRSLDGRSVSLADYHGTAILVNFWATWCGNCKLEMPWLAQLRERYKGDSFEVLGIVTDGASDQKVQQIAAKYGVVYPIFRCNHATAQAYGGLPELPASFFIDKRGKIVAVMNGADSEQEIEANIRKALGRQ